MDGLYMNTRIDVCVEVNHTRKARGLGNGRRQYNPTQRSVASLSDITLTSPCHWSLPSRSLLMHPPLPPSSPLPPSPATRAASTFFFQASDAAPPRPVHQALFSSALEAHILLRFYLIVS
jgi:hypothetical protein